MHLCQDCLGWKMRVKISKQFIVRKIPAMQNNIFAIILFMSTRNGMLQYNHSRKACYWSKNTVRPKIVWLHCAANCSNVVGKILCHIFGNIGILGYNIIMSNSACQLKITISDCAIGIIQGRELIAHLLWERLGIPFYLPRKQSKYHPCQCQTLWYCGYLHCATYNLGWVWQWA